MTGRAEAAVVVLAAAQGERERRRADDADGDSGSAAQPPQEPREERPGGAAVEQLSRDITALIQRRPISTTLAVIALCNVTSTVLAAAPSRWQAFRLWRRFVWVMLRDGVLRRPFPRRTIRNCSRYRFPPVKK